MKRQSLAVILVGAFATLAPFAPRAQEVTVTGYNQVLELGCDAAVLVVEGLEHQVNVTGPCEAAVISGVQNVVVFESAGQVTLGGANNRVTGAVTGTRITNEVDVSFAGVDNVLALRFDRAAAVDIAGSGNRLVWSTAPGVSAPQVRIIGENNTAEVQ